MRPIGQAHRLSLILSVLTNLTGETDAPPYSTLFHVYEAAKGGHRSLILEEAYKLERVFVVLSEVILMML